MNPYGSKKGNKTSSPDNRLKCHQEGIRTQKGEKHNYAGPCQDSPVAKFNRRKNVFPPTNAVTR
jgi:hypothetical protein